MVKIIDCPRDAIQGLKEFIPTNEKVEYINSLLKVGFHSIDFGSFVSHKAIPQLKDTGLVATQLDLSNTNTGLLAIVANERGAIEACMHDSIEYIGFPFSISETFLRKNINMSIYQAFDLLLRMNECIVKRRKKLVVHISMAFGNPYKDPYSHSLLEKWIRNLQNAGMDIIILSDTVGVGPVHEIKDTFKLCISQFPDIEFGAHLHSKPSEYRLRIEAAYEGGCRRFDGALKGFGGCPMSGVGLVGNIATENIIYFMDYLGEDTGIDKDMLYYVLEKAARFYPHH